MRYLFILAVLASSSANADEWTRADTWREVTYQVANVMDAYQTSRFQYRAGIEEVNPFTRSIIGPEPSTRDCAMYFATLGISHYLISRALPAKLRPYWQAPTSLAVTYTVYRNSQL